jgi:uncharacterized protein (UPF0262 family)
MTCSNATSESANRIIDIILDKATIAHNSTQVERERSIAILDLLENNCFSLEDGPSGPYCLRLGIAEKRLVFDVSDENHMPISAVALSLTPFSKLIKDYFLVCESYFEAIKTAPPARIEAIDMGRRSLHDEGSVLLMERLKGKITTDFPTARRLFTLICALHWKG